MFTLKTLSAALTVGALVTLSSTAQADTLLGIYADANYWHTSNDTSYAGIDGDYDDDGQLMISASLEHGVPIIPNVRVRHAQLQSEGTYESADSELDMSSTDVIAYYELLDNVVSVDLGLGAKFLQGDYSIGTDTTDDVERTLGMAYGSVGADLPMTGFSVKGELGLGTGSDVNATDVQAEVKYDFMETLALDMGAKVGYRYMEINYDDVEDAGLDTEFKGPYVGLEFHF